MTTNTTDIPTAGPLEMMSDRIRAMDPLSGPNVMRYAKANLKDNGDGTMTFMRPMTQKSNGATQKT